jgi:peroxiredoxin
MRLMILSIWIWAAIGIFAQPVQIADVGLKIENFQLVDIAGTGRSLQSYSGKIVVLVFWSYKCPVSLAYRDRMEELQNKYGGKGVAVLGVSPGSNESAAEIRANMSNLNIRIPVLLDSEEILAEKLGATHTPSVFILDGNAILRYKGSMDNNKRPGDKARIAYADDAIDAILAGHAVPVPETRAFGCSIRRKAL